jgi:tetratricopeptide (TPR) repeat protein
MPRFYFFLIFLGANTLVNGQQTKIDSLQHLVTQPNEISEKINLLEKLGETYHAVKKMDSSILAFQQALQLNEQTGYSLLKQCWNTAALDYILYEMGNYTESLKYAVRHLALSEKLNDTAQKGGSHLVFGHNYRELGDYRQALSHYFKAIDLFKSYHLNRNHPEDNAYTLLCIAQVYLKMKQLDSALIFTQHGDQMAENLSLGGIVLLSTRIFGDIYLAKGDDEKAMGYFRQYLPDFIKYRETNRDLGFVLNKLATIFQKRAQHDSAIYYAKKALKNAGDYHDQENLYQAAKLLSDYYAGKDDLAAFQYLKIATLAKDSMMSSDKLRQAQVLSYNEQLLEKEKSAIESKEAAKQMLLITVSAIIVGITSFLLWNRIRQLRIRYNAILEQKESEKLKTKYEKELLELEARALRAQMNPHFIFNCLNSIKSLIQQQEGEKSVAYLAIFSKLIRTLFNNADKKEINLYDEIETCKLYLQLESMRFETRFSYLVNADENLDLKSVHVPALIIQPFIENAIWHGIVPRGNGQIWLSVTKCNGAVRVIIEDDGIGREKSSQNKAASGLATHQSKGVNLTHSRLKLDNLLQQRKASLETVDKKDENGKASGTKVIITIDQEA